MTSSIDIVGDSDVNDNGDREGGDCRGVAGPGVAIVCLRDRAALSHIFNPHVLPSLEVTVIAAQFSLLCSSKEVRQWVGADWPLGLNALPGWSFLHSQFDSILASRCFLVCVQSEFTSLEVYFNLFFILKVTCKIC